MRRLILTMGVLLLALGVACASGPTATPAPPTATPTPTPAPATPTPKAAEAPAALKGAQDAMSKVKSFKIKGQITMTAAGTPVPGMPTGPQEFSMEISDKNYRFVQGDFEILQVDNTVYTKMGKDASWTKEPAGPADAANDEAPGAFLQKLTDPIPGGVESCPRGGQCQVITATLTETSGIKVTYKMWLGVTDGLVYKYQISETDAEGNKTEGNFEAYDYNVPVTIKAPIP